MTRILWVVHAAAMLALAAIIAATALPRLVAAHPMNQVEHFFDRPGGDYHTYKSNGWAQCATSCATSGKCRAYTYVTSTGICWMKNKVPKKVANKCCHSGIKVMGAREINFDRPGSDIKPGFDVDSFSGECENACKDDPKCKAYTVAKPGVQGPSAKCWLKNAKPAKVSNSCCKSGVKLLESWTPKVGQGSGPDK